MGGKKHGRQPGPGWMAERGVYPIGSFSHSVNWETRLTMYGELKARPIPLDVIKANLEGRHEVPAGVASDQAFAASVLPPGAPSKNRIEVVGVLGSVLGPPETAREAIAYFLSVEVDSQRKAGNSSARRGSYVAPTTVAWIAYDLLDSCRSAPGPRLLALIKKLMNVDLLKKKQSKQAEAFHAAIWIIGHFPRISSQEVADELGVHRSSVSRWRKDPTFKQRMLDHGFGAARGETSTPR